MIEGTSLQRGMNFRLGGHRSIFLMSTRKNAPYRDQIDDEGRVLIYEGHDAARTQGGDDPKKLDQPESLSSGTLTENGKFHRVAQAYKSGRGKAEVVRVYQKLHAGVWAFNGSFKLVDSWRESDKSRKVFKFRLELVDDLDQHSLSEAELTHSRLIPSAIKVAVYKRDKGQCVLCESKENLHFDHDFPFSKGGTSILAENVRLLCARHNLQKSDKIE